MRRRIEGTFWKIGPPGLGDVWLRRGDKARPAARFNRVGQDALYLSPDPESARIGIGQYVTSGSGALWLYRFAVGAASLADLGVASAACYYERARQPWIGALESGAEPPSWHAADDLRAEGFDGLIDPSRRRPGLWHVTLFRWNVAAGPSVRLVGRETPIDVPPDYR